MLARDRLRDRAQRAVAVLAEHEAVGRDGHAVVTITEVPDEYGAGRRDPRIAGAWCGRRLKGLLGRSRHLDDWWQGLEIADETVFAAEVLRHRLGYRERPWPLVALLDLTQSVRDRPDEPGSVARSRFPAEGVA